MDKRFASAVFAAAAGFYALAFLAPISQGDAAIFLIVLALLGQRLRPFLLLLAATVQDAPGSAYLWSYVSFVVVATLIVAHESLTATPHPSTAAERSLERITLLALAVVIYATVGSALQAAHGGFTQSADRPYFFVGGLMLVMIVSGSLARRALDRHGGDRRLLGLLAAFATLHALVVGVMQIFFGQEFYRSGENLAQVELSQQLVEAGAIGFARINGPFLSPNAFGYTMLLLATLSIVTLFDTARVRVFFLYVAAGFAAVLLSMSKALLGYYGLACAVLLRFTAGRAVNIAAYVIVGAALAWFLSSEYFQLVLDIFRVQEGSLGSRQWAWLAVIDTLRSTDWIFGIGLAAWPDFFSEQIGVALSDPHSLPLSVAGTFGLPGILFYFMLIGLLVKESFGQDSSAARRLGIYLLLLVFLVKDLVSIPAVLGNTPLTFMIWLLLGLVLVRPPAPSSAGVPHGESHRHLITGTAGAG